MRRVGSWFGHEDQKIHLEIPEMLKWMKELPKGEEQEDEYTFNLLAGERRAYNANALFRNPDWRKKDTEGALKIHPEDAADQGIVNGDWVRCYSKSGEVIIKTWVTDEMPRKMLSMPHGYGFSYPGHDVKTTGALVNLLTSMEDCDPLAKTPYHKNVRVNLEKVILEEVTS